MIPRDITSPAQGSDRKEWCRPELRKLPIQATATSPSKGGIDNADVVGGPKGADAGGQFS